MACPAIARVVPVAKFPDFLAEYAGFGSRRPLWYFRSLSVSNTDLDRLRGEHGRQFRTLVSDEDRSQFGRLGVACIGGNDMCRARRLKERLSDLECLKGTTPKLRADLALGDIGRD